MPPVIISPAAGRDIESILAWTHEEFAEKARLRYEALLIQGIVDVSENPHRAGSHDRPEVAPSVRTYHLWHCRNRVAESIGRVKNPRHFLLYRVHGDGQVELGRVLHDSMDIDRHLPKEYHGEAEL
ncbi:MAG: type II toxin-antitoxin system RelE/ParE family toxin [Planctomycetia bacterium]|nr:type II toxin-antitoxin system RelE/ParE family toxin [Planctomycetia bacterium]